MTFFFFIIEVQHPVVLLSLVGALHKSFGGTGCVKSVSKRQSAEAVRKRAVVGNMFFSTHMGAHAFPAATAAAAEAIAV